MFVSPKSGYLGLHWAIGVISCLTPAFGQGSPGAEQKVYRIALLITSELEEPGTNTENVGNVVTGSIAKAILAEGFYVIDQHQVEQALAREKRAALLALDEERAAALGLRLKADLLLTGRFRYESGGASELPGFWTGTATLTTQIIAADNGHVLASETVTRTVTGVDQLDTRSKALTEVANECGQKVVRKFLEIQEGAGTNSVTLVFDGVEYQELTSLKTFISSLPGVARLWEQEYNVKQVVFEINLRVDPHQLISAVLSEKCPVQPWELRLKSNSKIKFARRY